MNAEWGRVILEETAIRKEMDKSDESGDVWGKVIVTGFSFYLSTIRF